MIADGARTRRTIALIAVLTASVALLIAPVVGLLIASQSSGVAIGTTAAAGLGLNWWANRRRRLKR
ncbi:hypothetical protein [Lentzea cavernae]|uniref:hypothetical protein n=1 Tax=Lentzea cavernae TaxID=2020703 RepID=UPI001E316FCB|nr:hypothetical protein [Lentzea cavernae]